MTSLQTSPMREQHKNEEPKEQNSPQCTSTPLTGSRKAEAPFPSPPTTRIPHPLNSDGEFSVPLRRSASMRLRATKAHQRQLNMTGDFSTRAKLAESSSSLKVATPIVVGLTRNRTWCTNLGHTTITKSSTTELEEPSTHALCSDNQCLALTTEKQSELDMAASKSRNMSLKLNGGSAELTGNQTPSSTTTTTSTPKTPKTPLNGATITSPTGHNCCGRTTKLAGGQVKKPDAAKQLSTVHETKISPKTPPVTPDSPSTYLDDDLDSMYSFATTTSGRSTMSCEHPYVARNGTTFSGRKMKYVVHCSNYAGQVGPDYLTPTQRAQRQIRRLKELLCIARQDLEVKDTEILRLTREVVELRLFKASLSSPEERSASSDAVTVREAELKTSQDVSPIVDMADEAKCSPRHLARQQQQQHQQLQMSAEMQSSYADSGHFEDLTMSSVHSKDSQTQSDDVCDADADATGAGAGAAGTCADLSSSGGSNLENYELQRQELIRMYEHRIEELIRTQDGVNSDLKRSHNDKVEALLQKLAECNTRYSDMVPDYEHAKQRIRELEKQLEDLQRRLVEHEEKQNKMYLHMYQQGQEAERITRADQAMELAQRQPDSKVSINELLHQLQSTQDELENIRASECRMRECGNNHALLTAKEAISLWVLGARKTIYRRLLEAQKNRTHVDPEVTLQFLKSAIFYFLTDKENSQGHLQAIESILEFTDVEKEKISQARSSTK
ncbi:uncharacterized protein LOC6562309 isoform X2 [Drosophila grimshawi]|uniref:GH11490 n=1 Tax=Drosophila grimshawi TaxID=7222 RepID=B4JAT2_DROGR|nr:uncharacterized protein LOC6562309 isoform X2 [Drosophila grimshawi]EDW03890.1 GH11490 [Drosophila grimshawi]